VTRYGLERGCVKEEGRMRSFWWKVVGIPHDKVSCDILGYIFSYFLCN